MKNILILFISLLPLSFFASTRNDSLFCQLDEMLSQRDSYYKIKEKRIDSLKFLLAHAPDVYTKYTLRKSLYHECKKYKSNLAFSYAQQNYEQARELNNALLSQESTLYIAHLLVAIGRNNEAADFLRPLSLAEIHPELRDLYIITNEYLYCNLLSSQDNDFLREIYKQEWVKWKDLLLNELPENNNERMQVCVRESQNAGNFALAQTEGKKYISTYNFGTPEYANAAYYLSRGYGKEGNSDLQQEYLILSAISDIIAGVRDNASLSRLAELLYYNQNMDRAYRYINAAMSDATEFNSRMRPLHIARLQSIIDKAYQDQIHKQNKRLQWYLTFISVLLVLLGGAVVFIVKQLNKLKIARNALQYSNTELQNMNAELQTLNLSLSESDRVKEAYIGQFINICSTYIDKIDEYRKNVCKKITSGQTELLLKQMREKEVLDKELEIFYTRFDEVFLNLYPSFVAEFNELLVPDERIYLRQGEKMNTELRIFALIRLGITDSSQIASMLRYSVNTIYNYRAKVKNKAIGCRETFEEEVAVIGSIMP